MIREFGHWQGKRGRRLRSHLNDGLELVTIRRGQVEWQVEGRRETVYPGSLFFTLPWQEHGSTRTVEPGCELSYVVIPLSGGERDWRPRSELGLGLRADDLRALRGACATTVHAHPASARLLQALPALVDELAAGERGQLGPVARGLLLQVLGEVVRVLEGGAQRAPTDAEERVKQWVEAVQQDPISEESLERAAASCDLGRTRFADLVKLLTGDSPVDFRNRQRCELAARRLRETGESITTIALDCGFGTSQYFARQFGKFMGATPSAWRSRS